MNSLKKGERVQLLNFVGGPGVPLLNFEGGPGVPLLKFEGGLGSHGPGPTFTPCHASQSFKMWLTEYFLNSWHHSCETSTKMY